MHPLSLRQLRLRRIHPLPFGLPPFSLKGRRFDGQAKRLLYSGQTWKSYVGILQRMPKPGSFASIACPLSEHLRARPQDFHLQGGTLYVERVTCVELLVISDESAKSQLSTLFPQLFLFLLKAHDSSHKHAKGPGKMKYHFPGPLFTELQRSNYSSSSTWAQRAQT